ncbi:MAG: hypothetical protein QG635_1887, partial [Bacteroidota bacterium]|nr:hypothetical protein [Bacteroidota bacterium]
MSAIYEIDVKKYSTILKELFDFYQTSNLVDISPDEFQKAILTN